MEVSFNELRQKEVVNLTCGKRMGRISDLIMRTENREVLGLVVPGDRKLFRQREDLFIPWRNVEKIGDDVILVSVNPDDCTSIVKNSDNNRCKQSESTCDDDYVVG